MKTSSFFLSTLIAAAAMSAPAYADYTFSSNETVPIASDTEHTSVVVNEGVTGTFNITTNNADLKIGSLTLNGDLVVNEPVCALGEIGNISGTGSITLSKTTANNWGGALVLSGDSSGYTGTINIWNGGSASNNSGYNSQFLILKSASAAGSANVSLGASTVLVVATDSTGVGGLNSYDASTVVVSQASSYGYGAGKNPYNISYGGNNPINDGTHRTLNITGAGSYEYKGTFGSSENIRGLSLNWSGTGTQTLGGTNYINDLTVSNGTLVLGGTTTIAGTAMNAGNLTLGGTVVLSSGISNTGTVVLNEGVIFDLGGFNFTDGANAIVSGGTVTDGITSDNFQNVGVMRGGSFSVDSTTSSLSVTLTQGIAGTIMWNGGTDSVWNTSKDNSVWTIDNAGTAESTSFYFKDNVVFGADAENKTVTLEAGNKVTVGTVTVSGEGYNFVVASNATAEIAGEKLVVNEGASLTVGNFTDQSDYSRKNNLVSLKFDEVEVSGTLLYNNANDTWSSMALNEGSEFRFVDGDPNGNTLSVSTLTIAGNAAINAVNGKTLYVGALEGSSDLSITGSNAWGPLTVKLSDMTNYSGDLDLNKGTTSLVVAIDSGKMGSGAVTMESGVILNVVSSAAQNTTVDMSKVSGSGTVSLKLKADNGAGFNLSNFTGTIEVENADGQGSGRLQLNTSTFNAASAIKVLDGGDLVFNGDGTNISNDITFNANSTIYANNKCSGTLSGTINATGTITKAGGGTLNLTGVANIAKVNVSVGTLNVGDGGILTVTGDSNSVSDITGTLNVIGGGTLKLAGHDALGYDNRNASGLVVAQGTASEKIATILFADTGSFTLSKEIQLKGNTLVKNAEGNTNSIKAFGGQFTASGTNNTISASLFMSAGKVDFSVGKGGALTVDGEISGSNSWDKLGEGVLTLSGGNSSYTGTISVAGTLVAASTGALGSGNVSVANGAKLQISVENVDAGTINLASGATLVVDLADFADVLDADDEILTILTGTTLTFGDVAAASDTLTTEQLGYLSVTDSSGAFSKYVNKEWSYNGDTLSLTLTIPEPSAFGLLAGVGALALCVSRRRRTRR